MLCACKALVSLRHSYLGSFFLDPEDIRKLNIGAIWKFAKGTGLSLMGSNLTTKVAGGCPQGGVLSPLLWNLVDRLLTVTNDLGFRTFGYADDIVIIVQGNFANTLRELMQQALNVVVKWAGKEGLNINPHKTAIVPFTNKSILEDLGL
jgi:hypothetical protein